MRFKIDFERLFGKATDAVFAMGLTGPGTFREAIRPVLNGHAGGEIHKAQALAIEGLHTHLHVVERYSERFLERFDAKISYDSIKVEIAGKKVVPVGTASGVDPDAGALLPFSYLFGFQTPGPVLARPRTVEELGFREDSRTDDLYLPPTFSSQGVVPFQRRLEDYRRSGGNAVILPAVLGLPSSSGDLEAALGELEISLRALEPYADGFVWCPHWCGSRALISKEHFARTARLMANVAGPKLKLVEMLGFEEAERSSWLETVGAFLSGGGDGIVAVTGLFAPSSEVPDSESWRHDVAIACGRKLIPYRQRAIESARRRFPGAFIAACGGFHNRDEAFAACEYADVIAENEAYTRYGPGIARALLKKLVLRLNHLQRKRLVESNRLREYQRKRWAELEPGTDSG